MLNEDGLSDQEKFAFSLAASADFLLFAPLEDSMNGMEGPAIADRTEALLKKEAAVKILPSEMPRVQTFAESKNGRFHKDGFLVRKSHGKAPFAHILASDAFGTVLTMLISFLFC